MESMVLARILLGVYLLTLGGLRGEGAVSRLQNGGFETTAGWSLGSGVSIDTLVFRSGRRSLRVETSLGATAEQLVFAVTPGETLTACGWVKTQQIVPRDNGGFAFLAVYQYDAEGRLLQFQDFAMRTGTSDWYFASHTFAVHRAAEYLSLRAGIHNAGGTAWFDDLNLAAGDRPLPWTEPPAGEAPPTAYRAAILRDSSLPVKGFATPVETFLRALRAEGVVATLLSSDQLADPDRFNAARFDLLLLPTGATFPLPARKALLGFLRGGGDLLCTGGYAFDHLVVREEGRWIPYPRALAQRMERARDPAVARLPNGGFERGDEGWQPEHPAQCRVVTDRPFAGQRCAQVSSDTVEGGARYGATLPVEPGGSYLVGAHARTENVRGSGFAFLAVYQFDREGKLVTFTDFVQTQGTRDWTRYETRVKIAPSAARVVFYGGLYRAAGRLWLDEVTCAPVPHEERINAHYGEPADGLVLAPTQLTLFSPDQPLSGSVLVPAFGPTDVRGTSLQSRMPGVVRGWEATAQLRQNARWLPLLEARDRFGRFSGTAGALVTHFAGPFSGSSWAIFGVASRDVFAGALGERLLRQTIRLLKTGVQAERLETDYAIYHPGETASILLEVANTSRARKEIRVRLEILPPDAAPDRQYLTLLDETLFLEAGERKELRIPWRVSPRAPDFVLVRALLQDKSGPLDRVETGFCIYNARVMQRGPRITFEHNAFTLRDAGGRTRRVTLFGTDTYGNMFHSRSCNPLTWFRDLRMMRDYGLHMYENLQYTPPQYHFSEAQWRQFDALIQLSQRFGLPYMAGLLIGHDVVVDDAELEQQAAMCRAFAARYKSVPGLIYYLNGDFRLTLKDTPDIRRLWNDFLRQRYGSEEALRGAWGASAPTVPLGQIPVLVDAERAQASIAPGSWYDRRARDVVDFKAHLMRRWIGALCRAIRAEDAHHPITSEYYQRPIGGMDLRLTIDGMDAANYGYFGPPRQDIAQLLTTIKWNDMRFASKGVNMGEFGVKTHDAWAQERDPWGYHIGRTEMEQRRLFWWVVHAALAYGVSKIQNWCWSDDPDSVFPWGVAWNNPLRPKPVLKLYRNLRLFSDRVGYTDRRAPVVVILPDTWRSGAPESVGYNGLMNALEFLLATGAPFDVVNEADLPRLLTDPPRLALLPLAYALSDEAIEVLTRLAGKGSVVYLSGDPSVDTQGKRSPARLERLCGVRFTGEATRPEGLPVPVVSPSGAEVVENPASLSLYRHRIGSGRVLYTPEPWETLPGYDLFVRSPEVTASEKYNLYLSLLPLANVEPSGKIEAATGVWRVMEAPCDRGRLIALFPRAATRPLTRAKIQREGVTLQVEVRAEWPLAALLDRRERIVAATGGGEMRAGGAWVARGESPWMLMSLDDRPLEQSAALAAMLAEGGRLRWRSAVKRLSAWIIEWRDGQAACVASLPLRRRADGWEVTAPPNELLLIAPPEQAVRWLDRLKWSDGR